MCGDSLDIPGILHVYMKRIENWWLSVYEILASGNSQDVSFISPYVSYVLRSASPVSSSISYVSPNVSPCFQFRSYEKFLEGMVNFIWELMFWKGQNLLNEI